MDILMIPSWYPSDELPMNGSFFREQAQMLVRAGHRVAVLSPEPVFIAYWRGFKFHQQVEDGIPVLRFKSPSWPIGFRIFERFHYALLCKHLRAWLKAHKLNAQVIHAHSIYPALLLADPLSQALDLPLVLTEHRPSSLERPVSGFRGRALWRAVKNCRVRSVVSEPFARLLAKHWRTKPWQVLALPVIDDFFQSPKHLPKNFTFTHVSHLDAGKRVDMLITAFSELVSELGDSDLPRLKIVGGSPQKVELYKKQAGELGISELVHFTGSQGRAAVITEMSNAHCFVLPSEREAGGTVLSEAQACGTPILATKTWAGEFAVQAETGLLVEVNDLRSLIDGMKKVLRATFDSQRIREIARSRYSEQAFVSHSLELYKSAQEKSTS